MYDYNRNAASGMDERKAFDLVKMVREAEQHRRKAEVALMKAKLTAKELDPSLVREYDKAVTYLAKASRMIDDLYQRAAEIRADSI
jgi:hypothetical protein